MEKQQNPQQDNQQQNQSDNNNNKTEKNIIPDNENNENKDQQGEGDKFRKHETDDDHRDIPEIGEDEKEIERNTPRMQ